jgi:hypothetical protein
MGLCPQTHRGEGKGGNGAGVEEWGLHPPKPQEGETMAGLTVRLQPRGPWLSTN